MTELVIAYVDELPEQTRRGAKTVDWESALAPLKQQAGKWASVRVYKSEGGASRAAKELSHRFGKEYEFAARRTVGENGKLENESTLFVRAKEGAK